MSLPPAALTVYVPTYNRPQQLTRLLDRLGRLRKQYSFDVIISDNCSKPPILDTAAYGSLGFRFIRNKANLGMNANIVQAFLLSETDYLWIIGDDDLPTDDALKIIYDDITGGYDVINYEFNDSGRPRKRDKRKTGAGLRQFLEDMDYLAAALFLSCNVYRLATFVPFLRYGYDGCFSGMPHLAMTLAALKQLPSARYLFSEKGVVLNGWDNTPAELRWNWAHLAPRFPAVTRVLELEDFERTALHRKIFECLEPIHFMREVLYSSHYSTAAKAAALRQYRSEFRGFISPSISLRLWSLGHLPGLISWLLRKHDLREYREGRLD